MSVHTQPPGNAYPQKDQHGQGGVLTKAVKAIHKGVVEHGAESSHGVDIRHSSWQIQPHLERIQATKLHFFPDFSSWRPLGDLYVTQPTLLRNNNFAPT